MKESRERAIRCVYGPWESDNKISPIFLLVRLTNRDINFYACFADLSAMITQLLKLCCLLVLVFIVLSFIGFQ